MSTVAALQGGAPARPALRPAAVLAVASASSFLVYLDATIVNVAFPDVRASFEGATLAGLSWILSAYGIVFAALLVPGGRLADVVGGRRLFLAGLGLFTLGSALCALAPSVGLLVIARVLQAAGGALLVPASQLLVMAAHPPEKRMKVLGAMAAVAALASALGPVLGGLAVELGGWRLVFLVNLPIGIAALVAGRRLPSPPAGRTARRPDLLGSLLAMAAVGSLALGAVQGPVWGWADPRVIAAFGTAAVLTPLLLWRCASHPAPVLELALFRSRSFSAGNLGALLLGTSFFGLVLANSLFLTQVWGYSVLTAGLAIAPGPLASAVAAVAAARFTDRVDPRRFLLPGAVISAGAAAWLALQVGPERDFAGTWLPGQIAMGIGVGLGFATIVGACLRDLAPAQLGVGSGMSATTRQLGAVFGVAVLVAILGPAPGAAAYDAGWWAMGALALLAVIPIAALPRR
ncbi:MAG TPA: DHA2 family efflux MFS transporter permease subunit [Solirubrobacteraceae bacterium]|nr:DHA2 family efflux MFS transporter permease subunit [Solirubrobacteraceae bacterium]